MIKELHIQNYKAFENMKLEGFSQINLIGGLNNTGKTTLLEAIFNVYDRLSIDILLKQSVWRSGIPLTNLTQEIWSPAFHNFDISKNISFNYLTDKNIREELLISVDNTFIPENRTSVFDIINSASDNRDSGIKNALKIVLNTGDTVLQQTYHYLTGDKLNTLNKKLPAKNPEIAKYISTKNINTSMEAVLYGDIIKENLEKEVIKALQIIEPRLKMIIPVPIAENMTILYGDIGLKSKIPLYNLGDGLSRVLAFLNSIVKCKNGTVLSD
jgi:AAA15 family ATPase/GTPase